MSAAIIGLRRKQPGLDADRGDVQLAAGPPPFGRHDGHRQQITPSIPVRHHGRDAVHKHGNVFCHPSFTHTIIIKARVERRFVIVTLLSNHNKMVQYKLEIISRIGIVELYIYLIFFKDKAQSIQIVYRALCYCNSCTT